MGNVVSELFHWLFLYFSRKIKLTPVSRIDKYSSFEGHNKIGRGCVLQSVKVGNYSYLGNNCSFSRTSIGRFCSISSDVEMIPGTHPTSVFVSTHPFFFSQNCPIGKGLAEYDVFEEHKLTKSGMSLEIGNDVWIGSHVLLLEGVTIGNGAIIAAGSVVVKDVAPYSIVGGVPAKEIKKRFSDSDIVILENSAWWNWPMSKIISSASLFFNISDFMSRTDNG